MDNLNFKNLQLSYQAVYDETLCESMDELGLFGEYDYKELPLRTRNPRKLRKQEAMGESYELYELILSHLLDEGYTDNLESAIAIVENMSDEWVQDIVENKL